MIDEEEKPSPDELLKAIQAEEEKTRPGQLKIFFGMSAGVGKTYAMLQEAREKFKEGVNLVIGTINTHGRKETEALLEGLPLIEEKWVKYKDTVFEEMDLQTLLDIKPQLVIVDELAHTNVPGSKHPKRWQDVIDLLDAGIDVYTTLNVQHIESRKDIVESITGIQVRETVPDLILERANYIELIDIPPVNLLQRLKEGKVYLGEQSKIASEHFFQMDNLTALRQIALRFTAEKVDHELKGFLHGKSRKSRDRLMVGISPSRSSEEIIRSARRFAYELDAPWVATYVDTGRKLSDEEQIGLNRNFNLARDLGAEVITTHDLDLSTGLERIIKQRDITKIIIGRAKAKRFSFNHLFTPSLAQRLERDVKNVEIVIIKQEKDKGESQQSQSLFEFSSTRNSYAYSILMIALATLIGFFLSPILGYKSVGFIYLLCILILSLFLSRGPIFLAAVLSTLLWNFLFIPPLFTFYISDPEDIVLIIFYFFVAGILGEITTRMRDQDKFLHKREETMERLYEIEKEITNAPNIQFLQLNVCSRLEKKFPGKFVIFIKNLEDQLILEIPQSVENSEKEKAAAIWTFYKGKMSGWSTDTLPSSQGLYIPIKFADQSVGVLTYYPNKTVPLSMDDINFLQSVSQEIGKILQRFIIEEKMNKQEFSRQIERIHRSIFQSLNQSFYVPLEGLGEVNHLIQKKSTNYEVYTLTQQIQQYLSRIKFTVDNMITISELESGFVHFNKKKSSIQLLIDQSIKHLADFISDHPIKIKIPYQQLYLPFDFNLLSLALENLLLNAIEYSEQSLPITITLDFDENVFRLSVLDEGPGIPEDILPNIFNKFYRSSNAKKGLGIGLSIVKAVVDIHQGKIEVINREMKGTKITMILPIE